MIKKCIDCFKEYEGNEKTRLCPNCRDQRNKDNQKKYRRDHGIEPKFEHKKAVCLWCKQEFDFSVPIIIREKISKGIITNFQQLFCSTQCQNFYQREANLQEEENRGNFRYSPVQKYCPRCGSLNKTYLAVFCQFCKRGDHIWIRLEPLKEVKKDV